MQTRTDFYTASPDAMKAMLALEAAVGKLSIELPLLELVRLRSITDQWLRVLPGHAHRRCPQGR